MQAERDILSRLVFPRLRQQLAERGFSLREIDLRWGVTETMARDGGAIGICLNGIEECAPFVLGMLGHRFGWMPDPDLLEKFGQVRDIPGALEASLTELELRYAERTLEKENQGAALIPVMMRTARLSQELGHGEADPDDRLRAEGLRRRIDSNPATRVHVYDSLAEFEEKAYQALEQLLADDDRIRARVNARRPGRRTVERAEISSALSRYAFTGSPMLVLGAPGSGISTLLSEWRGGDAATLRLDGRRHSVGDMAEAIESAAGYASPITAAHHRAGAAILALSRSNAQTAIVIDHIETAALTQSHIELSWIPVKLGRSCAVVVATTNERLAEQADELGWQIIEMPAVRPAEITATADIYLGDFGKVLTDGQVAVLAGAPWASDFTSTRLALDELRRHGSFETLDARLAELARSTTPVALIDEVISGLAKTLPAPWCDVLRPLLVAIGVSWKGLGEEELLLLGSALAGRDPETAPMPAEVWNAMAIAADMLLVERGDTVDLRQGHAENWIEASLSQDAGLGPRVMQAFQAALPAFAPYRAAEEGPRLAIFASGEGGLADWLAVPENALALRASGGGNMAAWLENLPVEAVGHLSQAWKTAPMTEEDRSVLLEELAVFDRSEDAARPPPEHDRDDAFLREHWRSLARSALDGDTDAADAMLVWAEWVARGRRSVGDDLLLELRDAIGRLNDVMTEPHWLIASLETEGQLALVGGQPKFAVKRFEAMEVLARQTGMAAKLASALERQAAAFLELGRFRKARRKAHDCLDIASSSGIAHFEALAYERLIEIEQRRANWDAAYDAAAHYLRRARAGAVSSRRARAALDALEEGG